MAYTPDPTDATQPVDGVDAGTAAAEFRALKAYIAGLSVGALMAFQDRIINGKFNISQRFLAAAVSVAATSLYAQDRWLGLATGAGTFTLQQEADALYPGEFRLKVDVTVADAALAVGDIYYFGQFIEGHNVADLFTGSANARQITISFEVESEITGIFPIAVQNSAQDRSYVGTYTINAANTREQKTVTLTMDTAGTWLTTTGVGARIIFGLGVGATFNAAAAGVWSAGNFISIAGTTNLLATVNNTMWFKNIRLYRGAADLGVNQRSFADELQLCRRYFWKSFEYSVVPAQNVGTDTQPIAYRATLAGVNSFLIQVPFPVQMRVAPTLTFYSPGNASSNWWNNNGAVVSGVPSASLNARTDRITINNPQVAGDAVSNLISLHVAANAEF